MGVRTDKLLSKLIRCKWPIYQWTNNPYLCILLSLLFFLIPYKMEHPWKMWILWCLTWRDFIVRCLFFPPFWSLTAHLPICSDTKNLNTPPDSLWMHSECLKVHLEDLWCRNCLACTHEDMTMLWRQTDREKEKEGDHELLHVLLHLQEESTGWGKNTGKGGAKKEKGRCWRSCRIKNVQGHARNSRAGCGTSLSAFIYFLFGGEYNCVWMWIKMS